MPNTLAFLSRPYKSDDDYFEFFALSDELDAFDLEEATILGCGQGKERGDEVLFQIRNDRWVLAYVPYQDEESDNKSLPLNRELSPTDVSRWFRLNKKTLPQGLKPAAIGKDHRRGSRLTRLDRQWNPPRATETIDSDASRPNGLDQPPALNAESSTQPIKPSRARKPPSEKAVQTYRLKILQGKRQTEIAEDMSKALKRPVSQGTVSRYIAQVEKWIQEGNVLPELSKLTKKPVNMDPRKLEQGPRLDHRVPRQQPQRDD